MAKKDNQTTEDVPVQEAAVQPKVPETPAVALAPIAELSARVEELEKQRKSAPRAKLDDVSLVACNKRHREIMREVRGERKSVVEQVTKALTSALGGRATNERRLQKDLSRHGTEARATVKVDKA